MTESDTAKHAVLVQNLSADVTKQTLLDFFSFCGDISIIKLRRAQGATAEGAGDDGAALEALVQFSTAAAQKTALVLDSATIKKRRVKIRGVDPGVAEAFVDEVEHGVPEAAAGTVADGPDRHSDRVGQLRDEFGNLVHRASSTWHDFDEQHRISERARDLGEVTRRKTQQINEQYRISDRAREGWSTAKQKSHELDERWRVSERARQGWGSLKSSISKLVHGDERSGPSSSAGPDSPAPTT
ncbi:hypothetical protein CDCA_CDCA10G2926 [Cyanidium caldarium]|uniref:RRM domain-containing protein n=1 Tax=Cyanidium caldarium TaxID=2771 RepID=A0AAV9IXM3_CYACA|nr:hypothetical protein CDCA_CDCA10G2926 [Cyanidium caldarium]